MSEPTAGEVYHNLLDALTEFRQFIVGPPAPDEQVRAWRLFSGDEFGGVYCAEPGCGCEAENSQLIHASWGHEGEADYETFTLAELHEAIGEHIAHRAELRAEGQP